MFFIPGDTQFYMEKPKYLPYILDVLLWLIFRYFWKLFGSILRLGAPLADLFGFILTLGGSLGDHFGIIWSPLAPVPCSGLP